VKIKGKEKQIHKFVFVAGFMRVRLGDVCEKGSSNLKQSDVIDKNGEYEIYGASGLIGKVDFFHQEKPYIAVVKDGAGIGRTMLLPEKTSVIGTMQYILPNEKVIPKYLYYVIRYMHLEKYFTGATIPHIYFKDYKREEFNLCDLSEQEKIVSTLSKIEKIITHRKQQLEKLDLLVKARFVEMFGDPNDTSRDKEKRHKIGELCDVTKLAGFEFTEYINYQDSGEIIMLRGLNCKQGKLILDNVKYIDRETSHKLPRSRLYIGDILMTYAGTIGDVAMVDENDKYHLAPNVAKISIINKKKLSPVFLVHLFMYSHDYIMSFVSQVAQASINMQKIRNFEYAIPSIEEQYEFEKFVQQVDKSRVAIQNDLEQAQMLFDSLMQEYFG